MPEPTIIDRSNYKELGVCVGDVVLNEVGQATGSVTKVWGSPGTPCRITVYAEHLKGEITQLPTYDKLIKRGWRFCRIQVPEAPPVSRQPWNQTRPRGRPRKED